MMIRAPPKMLHPTSRLISPRATANTTRMGKPIMLSTTPMPWVMLLAHSSALVGVGMFNVVGFMVRSFQLNEWVFKFNQIA